MFAQMMKFQTESQQKKKWGKAPSTSERKRRKNLKQREKTTSERKRRKNLKNRGKNNNGSSLNCKNNNKHF